MTKKRPDKEKRQAIRTNGKPAKPQKPSQADRSLDVAAIDEAVKKLNDEYALILMGGKALVLNEYIGEDLTPTVDFLLPQSFRLFHNKFKHKIGDEVFGRGDLWLDHPARRDYRGVAFAPPEWDGECFLDPGIPADWYNLWRGFSVAPADFYDDPRQHVRHFKTFYDHILHNVAQGSEKNARYIWAWFAHMLQKPCERVGVAIVFRGRQGVGKTTAGDIVGSLFPEHYVLIDHPEHLTGKFNAHQAKALLLQADEGFWAGDKTAEGRLKGMISSSKFQIERKGVDPVAIFNRIHLLVSSNNSWVVPAGMEERRWAVFDVGDRNMQDRAFFKRLYDEINDGGRAHLLAYLLRFDLSSVNLNDIPRTEALFDQKVESMTEIQEWWYERLKEGRLIPLHRKWHGQVGVKQFHESYVHFVKELGRKRILSREQFGRRLKDLMPLDGTFKTGQKVNVQKYDFDPDAKAWIPSQDSGGDPIMERINGYHIPELDECRARFCELVKYDVVWPDDDKPKGGGDGEASPPGGNDAPPTSPPTWGEKGNPFSLDE